MIRHVVMWTFKPGSDAAHARELLLTCKALVPGTQSFEVAIRSEALEATCDMVLVSTFESPEALAAYVQDPHHQSVAAQIRQLASARHVLDYPCQA